MTISENVLKDKQETMEEEGYQNENNFMVVEDFFLTVDEEMPMSEVNRLKLPYRIPCASHTLNLIAKTDLPKYLKNLSKPRILNKSDDMNESDDPNESENPSESEDLNEGEDPNESDNDLYLRKKLLALHNRNMLECKKIWKVTRSF